MSNQKSLAKTDDAQGRAMVTAEDMANGGMPGFGSEDMVVPRMKIQQPTSGGDGTPGHFVDNLSGESVKSINATILRVSKGRVYWLEGEDEPVCKSDDNMVPSKRIDSPRCDACCEVVRGRHEPVCKFAKWSKEDGRNIKPPCTETWTFLGINEDTSVPFILNIHGMSLKAARKFTSMLMFRRVLPREVGVTLSLDEVKNAKGRFFVLHVSDFRFHEDGKYADEFTTYCGYDPETTYDKEREAASSGSTAKPDESESEERGIGINPDEVLPF